MSARRFLEPGGISVPDGVHDLPAPASTTDAATKGYVDSQGRGVFIQPTQPVVPAGVPYVWVQTGLGADGKGQTIWTDDGT